MYPMLRRRTFALALAVALLVLPATSLAQSAGDDQYNDPLAGQHGGHSGGGHSGGRHSGSGHSGASTGSTGTSGSGSASTPSPVASTTPSTASAGTSGPQTSAAARKQLPRTGFDVILTVELGMALLLTGMVTQRQLVLRDRRR
jgi:hypothetical protein